MQTNSFQTPSPLESDRRYAVSSQAPDSTPHIFGLSNPATVYKENKAIRLRHTPFNERWLPSLLAVTSFAAMSRSRILLFAPSYS